ncbi:MAG: NAD-dependent epimerase/dehydratase family protein [Spirochaetia bacterium]|nr:NAD-dependent epimerase/dehydratase family protein [Spirochaetia bacterium]
MQKILIIGSAGQIGSELVPVLREKYGDENIIAGWHNKKCDGNTLSNSIACNIDITDANALESAIKKHEINVIYHLASMLSAAAEKNPQAAYSVNMGGLFNVLEAARKNNCSVFFPSSIGAFGPSTPKDKTPQVTIQRPNTMYGITKLAGELLCDYYFQKYNVDTRGVRFPGLISYKTAPGGGTTDYAVEIFYAAAKNETYECFLKEDTTLDMMYMPDAISAMVKLMQADGSTLKNRNAYNITAMSFSPSQIFNEIKKRLPDFSITYKPDLIRQSIADSWPHSLNDENARNEWGWKPTYDLPAMVDDMIKNILSYGT